MRLSDLTAAREIAAGLPPSIGDAIRRLADFAEHAMTEETRSGQFSAALAVLAQRNGGTLTLTQRELDTAPPRSISGPGLTVEIEGC